MEVRADGFSVYLKNLSIADAADFAKQVNDPETLRNVSNGQPILSYPCDEERVRMFIGKILSSDTLGHTFSFSIRLVEDGSFVGCAGMGDILVTKGCSILYWLGKDYRGRGYASEAVRLLLKCGFTRLNFEFIDAEVYKSNENSISLLKRLKFIQIKMDRETKDVEKDPRIIFRMKKEDYKDELKIVVGDR